MAGLAQEVYRRKMAQGGEVDRTPLSYQFVCGQGGQFPGQDHNRERKNQGSHTFGAIYPIVHHYGCVSGHGVISLVRIVFLPWLP